MPVSSSEIEQELRRQADIHASVEFDDGTVVVSGVVDSERLKEVTLEMVGALAPDKEIVDNLDVAAVLPEQIGELSLSEAEAGDLPVATPGTEDDESLEAGDFTDQEILYNPDGGAGPSGTAVDEEISEGDEVWVPPTDPVRRPDGEFLGGFQISSTDEVNVARSALDGEPGDEAIADTVRRELLEDAATTDLRLRVSVRQGVVRLRGEVSTLEDAENAEEVASRVPGVTEVIDETKVRTL